MESKASVNLKNVVDSNYHGMVFKSKLHIINYIGFSKIITFSSFSVREPCSALGLKYNETVQLPDTCAPYLCDEDDKIALQNCGTVASEPPCGVFPGNVTLPFPDCCWEIICSRLPRATPRRPIKQVY